MNRIILILLTISFFSSCKQKEANQEKTDDVQNTSTKKTVTVEKHKDKKLFKGMFSYIAKTDEVAFTECNQEFAISLVPLRDDDFNSLFDVYKKVQSDNVLDYAYVEFNGYITDKTVSSEMDDMRTIRISEFLNIDKNKSCN